MRNDTRNLFNAYLGQLAKLHGVPNVTTKFATAPSVTQTLETRMQESSQFLSAINIYGTNGNMIRQHYGTWINEDGPDVIGMLQLALNL